MSIITIFMLVFVSLALVYTYWSMLRRLVKQFQLHWLPMSLILLLFTGLISGLLFLIGKLLITGTINAGTLLGMFFGITLIPGTIRTFSR